MKIGKPFMAAIIIAAAAYIVITTYNLSMVEHRLGEIEHFLSHQGFEDHSKHCKD